LERGKLHRERNTIDDHGRPSNPIHTMQRKHRPVINIREADLVQSTQHPTYNELQRDVRPETFQLPGDLCPETRITQTGRAVILGVQYNVYILFAGLRVWVRVWIWLWRQKLPVQHFDGSDERSPERWGYRSGSPHQTATVVVRTPD